MGTVCGVNTRRYHGLLIATLNPPSDRYSILPRVEETIGFEGTQFSLATVQYPGTVSPAGYQLLESFSSLPHPTWRYLCDSLTITKSVRLIDNEQSVLLEYSSDKDCSLSIRLFVSFRDYHSLSKQNSSLNPHVAVQPESLTIQPYSDLPPLTFHYAEATFIPDGIWFNNQEYLRELDRGLDFHEDLYSPGVLHFDLKQNYTIQFFATLENKLPKPKPQSDETDPFRRALDQFRVYRADGRPTLIAGYPWFTDWSRDTLISLPAFLAQGFDSREIKAILELLLAERKQGILPNRFSDKKSAPEFNTADASLGFFVAAAKYIEVTNDLEFAVKTLLPAALDILHWHRRGTFYGIQVDNSDHLLKAGEPGSQLTWMDAKIADFVVTPRIGKPVEINALWYNALRISSDWAKLANNEIIAAELEADAAAVKESFAQKFWNAERNCLYDVLTPTGPDPSLRPSQLFALSLPYPLIERARAALIVETVQRELLTPVGLRTLERSDPHYRPRYEGDGPARDSAYHQGTVWPWLIGPFVDAYIYAFGNRSELRSICNLDLMNDCCLGSICEVYDGDPPHRPAGCPAQLWSVAQISLALRRMASN